MRRPLLAALDALLRVEGTVLRPLARLRAGRLRRSGLTKIHCGCGLVLLDGWANVDYRALPGHLVEAGRLTRRRRPSLYADLRRGIPFPTGSATHVYSNNFLEHLTRDDGLRHLNECLRVLRPGGRIRIVVPDVERYATAYISREPGFVQMLRDGSPYWPSWLTTQLEALLTIVHGSRELGWPHGWGYDFETLRLSLERTGFVDVHRYELDESDDPELRGIDGDRQLCVVAEARRS
jgi:predicted SAM-dependent methyltransferase